MAPVKRLFLVLGILSTFGFADPTITDNVPGKGSAKLREVLQIIQEISPKFNQIVASVEINADSIRIVFNEGSQPIELNLSKGMAVRARRNRNSFQISVPSDEEVELRTSVKRALISHGLHPHIQRPGHPFISRASQILAALALNQSIDSNARSFLNVSPTRTGKTELLIALYERLLRAGGTHVVLVDNIELLDQHQKLLAAKYGETADIRVFAGDASDFPEGTQVSPFSAELFESGEKPRIILSTIHQFRGQADALRADDKLLARIAEAVKSICYDEAHHLGADKAFEVVNMLLSHPASRAFLLMMTATPLHNTRSIPNLFRPLGANVYYSYVDVAEDAFQEAQANRQDHRILLYQLSEAMRQGDLTPIGNLRFLTPGSLDLDEDNDFYVKGDFYYEINPDHYGKLFSFLQPSLESHKKGLIVVRSIDEADRIANFLNKNLKGRRVQSYHSDTADGQRSDIRGDFLSGAIDYLVVVNTFQEGVTVPNIDLYVDLTTSSSARSLIQKFGRPAGLEEGKIQFDAIMGFYFDEDSIDEDIMRDFAEFLDRPHVFTDAIDETEVTEDDDKPAKSRAQERRTRALEDIKPQRRTRPLESRLTRRGTIPTEDDVRDILYPSGVARPDIYGDDADRIELLKRVIRKLGNYSRYQQILTLMVEEGLEREEICERLGITDKNFYSQLQKHRPMLRNLMRQEEFIEQNAHLIATAAAGAPQIHPPTEEEITRALWYQDSYQEGLTPRTREVAFRVFIHEESYAEAARVTRLSTGRVQQHANRARTRAIRIYEHQEIWRHQVDQWVFEARAKAGGPLAPHLLRAAQAAQRRRLELERERDDRAACLARMQAAGRPAPRPFGSIHF